MGLVARFSNLNAQYHILSYLGPVWGCFDCVGHMDDCPECVPRFNDTQVRSLHCCLLVLPSALHFCGS